MWLVRHGDTEWSRDGKHTSRTDPPLTEQGLDDGARLASRLQGVAFDLVMTSPRQRARHTAELAGFADAVVDDDVVEWDYGEYEGVTTAEIRETVPGWSVWTHPSPGGESADEISQRLDRLIARLRSNGRRALIFGHGHSMRALAARWIGQPVQLGRFLQLDTATVSVLGEDRGTPVIVRWNA